GALAQHDPGLRDQELGQRGGGDRIGETFAAHPVHGLENLGAPVQAIEGCAAVGRHAPTSSASGRSASPRACSMTPGNSAVADGLKPSPPLTSTGSSSSVNTSRGSAPK